MVNGQIPPTGRHARLCHEGYVHQSDIIYRLGKAGIEIKNTDRELVAPFDDRFRGHIEGEVNGGDLLEVKSIHDDAMSDLLRDGMPFSRHYEQVQCYMHYGEYTVAYVVYKTRGSGDLWVFQVRRDISVGLRLETKAKRVLAAIDSRTPPQCECGRCNGR